MDGVPGDATTPPDAKEEEGEREAAVGAAVEEEAGLDPTATAAKTTFAADAAFLQYLVITFCART